VIIGDRIHRKTIADQLKSYYFVLSGVEIVSIYTSDRVGGMDVKGLLGLLDAGEGYGTPNKTKRNERSISFYEKM